VAGRGRVSATIRTEPDQHRFRDAIVGLERRYCAMAATPESTVTQYPRPGIAYRPLRDAPPVPVRLIWWRDEAHPATAAAVGLLTSLFRGS